MTELAARHAAHRSRVLREGDRRALTRLAWGTLMQLHHALTYQPVWGGAPVILNDWIAQQMTVPRLPELAALAPALGLVAAADSVVRADRLAGLLWEALRSLETPRAEREFAATPRSFDDWREKVRVPRAEIVEEFARAPIPGLRSLLLQGSLADGRVVNGYSDFDAVVILRVPAAKEEFQEQVQALLHLNHHLVAHNPAMHHGPMVYFEGYLQDAAEAVLPSAVLANSVLLAGEACTVYYGDSTEESWRILDSFEHYFCTRFSGGAAEIRTGFDALWWISMAIMIPLLDHQRRTGVSIWKRELLPALSLPYVRRLTECREALGAWMTERIGGESCWPQASEINPGLGVAHWRQRLRLDRDIGLDDWLVAEVRAAIRDAAAIEAPRRVARYPRPALEAEYDALRAHWLGVAAAGAEAVYEFGSVGCPGLSDLDLLFVLRDGADPAPFTLARCSERQKELMGHDPMVVSRSAMPYLPSVLPFVAVRHLAGNAFHLPVAEALPHDTIACAMTAYNFRKYPADINALAGTEPLNFHLTLAYLHSFSHVARMFELLGEAAPRAVVECVDLDAAIRTSFRAERGVAAGELAGALAAMRAGAEEAMQSLDAWWRRRLFAPGGRMLPWVCAYLADPELTPYFRNAAIDGALQVLEPYRMQKRAFLAAMRDAGLAVDAYLVDWRFAHDLGFREERFALEAAMGGEPVGIRDATGREIRFTAGDDTGGVLLGGWSSAEEWGTWTDGGSARLIVRTAGQMVRATGRTLLLGSVERQRIEVRCNGELVGEWAITENGPRKLPPFQIPGGAALLEFRCPDAKSPRELGYGEDDRKLGLGLTSLVFYDGSNE
ncbi:MAG: hypothetical protein FJW30_25290 [Acidobacteria bacterium]|nr:hypothetical protein [Acidobacteriota bacterium]